jgi:hypothetical protein
MKYAVKRYWQFCDAVEVEADSIAQAIERAHEMPLNELQGEYILSSLYIDPSADVAPLVKGGVV